MDCWNIFGVYRGDETAILRGVVVSMAFLGAVVSGKFRGVIDSRALLTGVVCYIDLNYCVSFGVCIYI